MTIHGPLYTNDRRRCVAPDGTPGNWQDGPLPTQEARAEAVRLVTGKTLGIDQWPLLRRTWRELMDKGWSLESESTVRSRTE